MKTVARALTFVLVFFSSIYFSQDAERAIPTPSLGERPIIPKKPIIDLSKFWSLDIYGAIPYKYHGAGGGFGMFTPALKLGPSDNAYNSIQVRLGLDFYIVETGHKTFRDIPLSAPQTGDAKVRMAQNNVGLNLTARFSLPYSNKFIPYADIFGGCRAFDATMNISPNVQQTGYNNSTSSNLSSSGQWCYGGAIGVMYSLGKYVKLNTGLMYTTSPKKGEIVDVLNARNEANNIITQKISTPKDMFIFKVGFTFLLDFDDSNNSNSHRRTTYRSGGSWGGGGGGKSSHVNINVRPSK